MMNFLLYQEAHLPVHCYYYYTPAKQMMMKEQDQGLEELGTAVDRVGRLADAMNQELNAQNK